MKIRTQHVKNVWDGAEAVTIDRHEVSYSGAKMF